MTGDVQHTDVLILGAGSAGCVLANRLSADPHRTVRLLEAGGYDRWHWIHIPIGYLYTMGNPKTDWCYHTTPQPRLHHRSLPYPRGRVLGGSSSINGMIYMRGQRQDYDNWGLPEWSWDAVLPYFRRSEHYHRGADEAHGGDGPLRVESQRLHWPILDAFKAACEAMGFQDQPDFNRGENAGVGYFEVNQNKGRRLSSAGAFLHPIRHRSNLTLDTGCVIDRLELAGHQIIAVQGHRHGRPMRWTADRIVLATGAVATPVILERSGIGDPAQLALSQCPVHHPLPGVGQNLQDHLQLRMAYRLARGETLNQRANRWQDRLAMALEYGLKRSGPLSMAPSQLGAFFCSSPATERPDLEFHIQPLSAERLGTKLHPWPGITASVCHLRPHSRGSVHAVSTNPADSPRIDPNYLADPTDQSIAVAAMRQTRALMEHPLLAEFGPEEWKPGRQVDSDAEFLNAAGQIASTIFHPVGTAKMGVASDPTAVVSPRLQVHGLDNLWVGDASVFPTIPSGNTHAPTVMIAERLADWLLAD
ncbi:MAG: choline dehydrogenase [Gammaproteobacteria bacterium]|nr:choline dehydrogenase [Gammaproteobacteria bacterium]